MHIPITICMCQYLVIFLWFDCDYVHPCAILDTDTSHLCTYIYTYSMYLYNTYVHRYTDRPRFNLYIRTVSCLVSLAFAHFSFPMGSIIFLFFSFLSCFSQCFCIFFYHQQIYRILFIQQFCSLFFVCSVLLLLLLLRFVQVQGKMRRQKQIQIPLDRIRRSTWHVKQTQRGQPKEILG